MLSGNKGSHLQTMAPSMYSRKPWISFTSAQEAGGSAIRSVRVSSACLTLMDRWEGPVLPAAYQ